MNTLKKVTSTLVLLLLITIVLTSPLPAAAAGKLSESSLSPLHTFGLESKSTTTIALSNNGEYFANADLTYLSVLKNNGPLVGYFLNAISALLFSPDSQTLAIGGYKKIFFIDIASNGSIQSIDIPDSMVTSLAFSPDNNILAVGLKGEKGVVQLWDMNSLKLKKELTWESRYFEQVADIAFSPDGTLLAATSLDPSIPLRIWESRSYKSHEIPFDFGVARKIVFSPDSTFLLAALDDNRILKISYLSPLNERFSFLPEVPKESGPITDLHFTLTGGNIISSHESGSLHYRNSRTGKLTNIFKVKKTSLHSLNTTIGLVAAVNNNQANIYQLPDMFPPEIVLTQRPPLSTNRQTRDILIDSRDDTSWLQGIVNDESDIKAVFINGVEVKFKKPSLRERKAKGIKGRGVTFKMKTLPSDALYEIVAIDVHGNRAVEVVEIGPRLASSDSKSPGAIGKNHALIIGNNDYKYLTDLKTTHNDAKAIADILEAKYGFEAKILLDGTRENILGMINDYRKNLSRSDNLLIYYAGHGHYDKETEKAYWLPVESQPDNTTNWIIVDNITTNLKKISSDHILIVADSCYSGALTRDAGVDLRPTPTARERYLTKMFSKKSRTLLSSGGNEPVSDGGGKGHSVFADVFIRALNQMDEKMFTAEELFNKQKMKESITGRSSQTPEYNYIRNSGHDHGDFVFSHVTDL